MNVSDRALFQEQQKTIQHLSVINEDLQRQIKELKEGIVGPDMTYEDAITRINVMMDDYGFDPDERYTLQLAIESLELCAHIVYKIGKPVADAGEYTDIALKALRAMGILPWSRK